MKRLLALLLALLMACSLCACGSKAEDDEDEYKQSSRRRPPKETTEPAEQGLPAEGWSLPGFGRDQQPKAPEAEATYEEPSEPESNIEEQKEETPSEENPISMHYYEEMYRDQTYVLDYTLFFDHDSLGRITTVSQFDSDGNFVSSVEQTYDPEGNCTQRYSLSTNLWGLYLEYYYQYWDRGSMIKSERSDHMYCNENEYDESGKLSTMYFYENGRLYMADIYTYDGQGRVVNKYRENYGNWAFDIEYYYHGSDVRPYCIQWGENDYYMYEYEFDEYGRLISETELYYSNDELGSITVKTYEY